MPSTQNVGRVHLTNVDCSYTKQLNPKGPHTNPQNLGKITPLDVNFIHFLRLFLGRNVQVAADVISCTSAINACEKDGRWWMAVKIFESLYKSALQPDQISFNTTIRACAKDGQWLLALELLDLMQDEETLGGQFHSHFCICAISAQQYGAVDSAS